MEIKIKFNIDQQVYVIDKNQIISGTVVESTTVFRKEKQISKYLISVSYGNIERYENQIFSSKNEVLKSIDKEDGN